MISHTDKTRRKLWVVPYSVGIVAWSVGISCFAQTAPSTSCAVMITAHGPQEVDGTRSDGEVRATGTLVWHKAPQAPDPHIYLVTAFHVIRGRKTVEVNLNGRKSVWLGSETFESRWAADTRFDLAIFKFRGDAPGVDMATGSERVPAGSADLPAFRVLPLNEIDEPKGTPVVAVGNPKIDISSIRNLPENIAYGSVVAEHEVVGRRIGDALRKQNLDLLQTRLIYVETLSIAQGFSGGPLISGAFTESDASIVGIILGGTPDVKPGRFAWGCPSQSIAELISDYEGAKLSPPTSSRREYGQYPPVLPWLEPLYKKGTQSSLDDERQFEGQVFYANDVDKIVNRNGTRALRFLNCDFIGLDFNARDLSRCEFEDCNFIGCSFNGAVLIGSSFSRTRFSPREHDPAMLQGLVIDGVTYSSSDPSNAASDPFFPVFQ